MLPLDTGLLKKLPALIPSGAWVSTSATSSGVQKRGDDWLTRLLNERRVRVHVYRCSARAAKLASVTEPKEVEAGLKEITDLEKLKRHDTSQLGASLRQVLNV